MNAPRPPAAADSADDDQRWFDLLAGRPRADTNADTQADALRLRQALLQHRPAAPAGAPAAADARIARLLGRARAQGVLPSPPPAAAAPATRPGRGHPRAWAGALAAGVAALGITLLLQRPADAPAPEAAQRGAAVQQLQVADPPGRRLVLLQALRAAGFDAQPFDRLGRPGLDIALPVPLPAAQARALADLGITAPAGPSLLIELLPAAPASATSAR